MASPPSLLTELPGIIHAGRREAAEAVRLASERRRDDPGSTGSTGSTGNPGSTGNLLIHGDNLDALAQLVAVDTRANLVYLDPPFDSKADYRSRIRTRDDAGTELALEMHTYTDRWPGGTADYLRMLVPRLVLAREVLRADGAICVHLDWHCSHYVRVVLDEVFGRDHFVNSLVWSYRTGGASRTSAIPRKHDDLLIYRRSESFRIRPQFERQYLERPFMGSRVDAEGRHYVDTILRDVLEGSVDLAGEDLRQGTAHSGTAHSGAAHSGTAHSGTAHSGTAHSGTAQPSPVQSISVRPVLNVSAERTGYATQKPEGLLEVLLRWLTGPGDLVIDPFGGSGTSAVVAERSGRRWVSIDASARSLVVTRARLDALGAAFRLSSANSKGISSASPGGADIAEYDLGGSMFRLRAVHLRDGLGGGIAPARGTDAAQLARAFTGSGLGALAGWHLWSNETRITGAWRDARGNLATDVALARQPDGEITLELVLLTGERSTMRIPTHPVPTHPVPTHPVPTHPVPTHPAGEQHPNSK